jgi:hypothetical protein
LKGREASLYARVALLVLLIEFANHPVCAAKERDLLIEAQPPLEKEGIGLGIIHFKKHNLINSRFSS